VTYDLLIRGGTVVDGSGLPRFRADVGIRNGRIIAIGRLSGAAAQVLDADGHIVAPGFIDAHTHMDAQLFWDPLGTCSSWHGVTTAVMGNCGFSLAPCNERDADLVLRNLQRAEDISPQAMKAGIKWSWETYAEYLATVDAIPKGINYAAYIGHSSLRTYVMGERAFSERANSEDLANMKQELEHAIRAGAISFSTSRTRNHLTPDGRPVASVLASWDEVVELVKCMSAAGGGMFELAHEDQGRSLDRHREYLERLKRLTIETGVPIAYGLNANSAVPELWRLYLRCAEEASREGGRVHVQIMARETGSLMSFATQLPFDDLPDWKAFRQLPLAEQGIALRDAETRQRLLRAAADPKSSGRAVGVELREANFEDIYPLNETGGMLESISVIARKRNRSPIEVFLDLALERGLETFFLQVRNNRNPEDVLEMLRHPNTVVTFTDAGAHVTQIMEASLHTHVLSHWVRERGALGLEEAVRLMTFVPASCWGFRDRGLLREGSVADIVVFDPQAVGPLAIELVHDLPAGAPRLIQKARGYLATIVYGQVLLREGRHSGRYPGRLIRRERQPIA